jgi:hypothetical protein
MDPAGSHTFTPCSLPRGDGASGPSPLHYFCAYAGLRPGHATKSMGVCWDLPNLLAGYWGEGEHASFRSTTSSSHRAYEGHIHRTRQNKPKTSTGQRPVRIHSISCCKTKDLSKSTGLLRHHRQERLMWNSAHGDGPREDKHDKGRVSNKVYLNGYL